MRFPIVLILAFVSWGCSSSNAVRGVVTSTKINEELKGRLVSIELKDGRTVSAKGVSITEDSVSWVDRHTDEGSKAGLGQVNKIVIVKKNYLLGAMEGFGFGTLGGATIGFVASGGGPWGKGSDASIIAFALLAVGTAAGAGIGLITGAIIGHSNNDEYTLADNGDSSRTVQIKRSSSFRDVVYLKNGITLRGTILIEERNGERLVRVGIRDADGEIHTYTGSEVERIEREEY